MSEKPKLCACECDNCVKRGPHRADCGETIDAVRMTWCALEEGHEGDCEPESDWSDE